MATRVQFRRGTTSEHSSFTGAVGEVTVDMATQVLKGLPIFDQHFRGETYESLMQKIVPYQAADPPGQKMFAWDIEFLSKDAAANAIRQILVAANN